MGIKKNHTHETHCRYRLETPCSFRKNNGSLETSHSACLKDKTGFRVLPEKDPIGNSLSSFTLITFSKHSSRLIYTLFF